MESSNPSCFPSTVEVGSWCRKAADLVTPHVVLMSRSDPSRYDALTTSNKVSYQNALNVQNMMFAKACGGILTNYCWKEGDAAESMHNALQNDIPLQNVYLGVDVWAQNTTKLTQPRVTYPEYGGGGTNTGVAVAKVAELGLSVGVFAPAWTFEHFPGYGKEVEQTLWDGVDLPANATCPCGDPGTRHQPNKTRSMSTSARMYSASSKTFFYTDFCRAFSRHGDRETEILFDGCKMHAQLGSQSILPLRAEKLNTTNLLRHKVEDTNGRSQLVIEYLTLPLPSAERTPVRTKEEWKLPLFKFDMPADGSLRLRISYRDLSKTKQGASFYIIVSGMTHNLDHSDQYGSDHHLDVLISIKDIASPKSPRLEELGFLSKAIDADISTRLAEVDYICIQPVASHPSLPQLVSSRNNTPGATPPQNSQVDTLSQNHTIFNIRKISRDVGEMKHIRLCWDHTSNSQSSEGMPYSAITGPFSYFAIYIDDLFVGRAYVPEHVLPVSFKDHFAAREVPVQIKGIGFDGQELASSNTTMHF
jgi:hypothetical protein